MGRRGFSVGTLVIVGMLCTIVAFIAASLCTFQLNASTRSQNSEQALHLAEGAIAMTVARIHDGLVNSTPYGLHKEQVTFYLDPAAPTSDHCGQVSFDTTTPWGYSTNDFDGTHSIGWNNMTVPQSTVHVVAMGVSGSTTRLLEVLVGLPQFQYVLAVDGPLQSIEALNVKAEPDMPTLFANPTLSNSNLGANVGSNQSIMAGSGSFVSGDVVSTGAIDLGNPSTVLGVVRNGQISTPHITISQYNDNGPGVPQLSGTLTGPVAVKVNTYSPGPLVVQGDLQVVGATLYVDGGLTVNGALTGTGAVFCHGNVVINGGADLDAQNLVALLATGDVSMAGTGTTQKYFQGLVYTDGAFSASNITIAGAFVSANSADGTGSGSSLTLGPNTQVVYVQGAATIPGMTGTVTTTPVSLTDLMPLNSFISRGANMPTDVLGVPPPAGSAFTPSDITAQTPSLNAICQAIQASMGTNPQFQQWMNFNSNTPPSMTLADVMFSDDYEIIVHAIQYNPATNQFDLVSPVQVQYAWQGTLCSQAEYDAGAATYGTSSALLVPLLTQAQLIYRQMANQDLTTGGPAGTGTSTASVPNLILNDFLSDQDPVRIISWREH